MDKKLSAKKIEEKIQEHHQEYMVGHWFTEDKIGIYLMSDVEFISIQIDEKSDEKVGFAEVSYKLDNLLYNKHVKYHPNVAKLRDMINQYGLEDRIHLTDELVIEGEEFPGVFDISVDGVLEITESEDEIYLELDEGNATISKNDTTKDIQIEITK